MDSIFEKLLGLATVEPCGSRVTCRPAPTETDRDYLVEMPNDETGISQMVSLLANEGFRWEGQNDGSHYQSAASDFMSWRRDDINLIVTSSADFAHRHRAATALCTRLNLLVKDDRIALFQAVLYGDSKFTLSQPVVAGMKHVLHSCNQHDCNVCVGGLALCTVCGGAEGALPTDCPGTRMDAEIVDQVYRGEFDFVGGKWVNKMALDISGLPAGCDWIIGYTNGGLTIHAQVGPGKEVFGDTPQEALNAAIAAWNDSQKPDDDLLV